MKINILLLLAGLCFVVDGYGQTPEITFSTSIDDILNVKTPVVNGLFHIDTIIDWGPAYLIYVTKMDSSETVLFSAPFLYAGIPLTIISFKDEGKANSNCDVIQVRKTYKFTLSPSDGCWILWPHSDLWKFKKRAISSNGEKIEVPLPLIKNQLLISKELYGLYFCPF